MNDERIREFKPNKRPYIVFFIIFLPLSVLMFIVFLAKPNFGPLGMIFILPLICLGFCLWVFHNRVAFSDEGVALGRFLLFRKYLAYEDIQDFYALGIFNTRPPKGPPIGLIIEPKPNCNRPAIKLPVRIFSFSDFTAMMEILSQRVAHK